MGRVGSSCNMHCSLTNDEDQAVDHDNMVEFKLQGNEPIVVFKEGVMSLFDVAQGGMKSNVSRTISYQTMTMGPAAAGSLTLDQTHRVVQAKKDDPSDDKTFQTTIGAKLAYSDWDSHVSAIIWVVWWTAKGLMPIKPVVYSSLSDVLAAGRSLSSDAFGWWHGI